MQIREIGEQGLLRILQGFCPLEIVGDDGAVLPWVYPRNGNQQTTNRQNQSDRQSLVVTTDVLVEGVHFSDRTTRPSDAGWRAVAANLSDLAAMGAEPVGITVGLGLRGETEVSWLEGLYQGMTECLQQTPIVGGDVVRSPTNTIAINAFGRVDPQRVIRRNAAQVGDAIVITGSHGKSKAGLELLLYPEKYQQGSAMDSFPEDYLEMIRAHQRPQPRLDVLPYLADVSHAGMESEYHVAGMDSSDGLVDAICQICRASGVGARIDRAAISIPEVITRMVSNKTALDWVLYGGEDFELVLCLPLVAAQSLVQSLGAEAAIIGTITSEPAILLLSERDETLNLSQEQGFQHF
jgi:thiamine-monophosphate kinase